MQMTLMTLTIMTTFNTTHPIHSAFSQRFALRTSLQFPQKTLKTDFFLKTEEFQAQSACFPIPYGILIIRTPGAAFLSPDNGGTDERSE